MVDVRDYFRCSIFSSISYLALLIKIWYLADIFDFINILSQSNSIEACNLSDLCDIWVQCMDIP